MSEMSLMTVLAARSTMSRCCRRSWREEVGEVVPMSLALSVHRTRSTLVSLMPFWWRARLMADVTLAVSLGVRRDTPACTNSKVRWSMVGCGLATGYFFEALLAFLL